MMTDLFYQRGAALEIYISKVVHVNGKALDKAAKVTLIGGDEVIFVSSLGRHAYVSFCTASYFLMCFSVLYFPCWKLCHQYSWWCIQSCIWIWNPLMCWQIFQQLPEEKSSTSSLCSTCVIQQEQYPVLKGTPDHLSSKGAKISTPFNFGNGRPPLVPHGEPIL